MLKAGHRGTRCAAAPGRQRQHQHPARDEEETEGLAPDLDLRGIHPGLLEKLEESHFFQGPWCEEQAPNQSHGPDRRREPTGELSEDEQHGGDHGCHVHGYPTQSVGVVVLNGGAEKEEARAKPRRPADETEHLLPPRRVVVKARRLVRPAAG